jgi:hypothetical protein
MNWRLHNLIADMPGSEFLWLYGCVAALVLVTCWWKMQQEDTTASLPSPPIPTQPDPYEIAYLCGGENYWIA